MKYQQNQNQNPQNEPINPPQLNNIPMPPPHMLVYRNGFPQASPYIQLTENIVDIGYVPPCNLSPEELVTNSPELLQVTQNTQPLAQSTQAASQ